MFKKFILVSSLLVTSLSAQAGLISGTHTTTYGSSVNLQGLEWMPLTYTAGISRNQIESDTWTDRFGGSWSRSDWRYATRAETAILLQTLTGGATANPTSRISGAVWFAEMFGFLAYDTGYGHDRINGFYQGGDGVNFFYGATGECSIHEYNTCYGTFTYNQFSGVRLRSNSGLDDKNPAPSNIYRTYSNYDAGSLLVRVPSLSVNPVSAPSALSLFALGLCGLLLRRRKIAA